MHEERCPIRVVNSALSVKRWLANTPSCDLVRPGQCPACQAPSRPLGQPFNLVGHGIRLRDALGPAEAADGPGHRQRTVPTRRYRCRACEAVIAVLPRQMLPRYRYTTRAIAYALALWGLVGMSAEAVRRKVSAWGQLVGFDEVGFRSLVRWANAIKAGRLLPQLRAPPSSTLRQLAAEAAQHLLSSAPTTPQATVAELAMVGASRATWCRAN